MICKNCRNEITSNYCPDCGQPAKLKRIDGRYILEEIEHVLEFERGILYTIKELVINPGQNVRNYLFENRSRLVKPLIFTILTSLVYSLCNTWFHFEDGYTQYLDTQKTATTEVFKWVQEHYGYANIIMGLFIAFWTKLFFRKSGYNIFEILILLCFVMGIGMLIYSVFGIIQILVNRNLMQVAGVVGFMYTTWAIGQFYEKGKVMSYVKAFFAYVLGMLSFTLAAMVLGILIDQLAKH